MAFHPARYLLPLAALAFLPPQGGATSDPCSRPEYDRCVRAADPLVRDPDLVFPSAPADVERVCRAWDRFVACLAALTARCFAPDRRRRFDGAVRGPVESVRRMCADAAYRAEYLRHAACLKGAVVGRCGREYEELVRRVARSGDEEDAPRGVLCCAHEKFKRCVSTETTRVCDGGIKNGAASQFSGQIVEKALSFLSEQCSSYTLNVNDCDIATTNSYITPSSGGVYDDKSFREVKKTTDVWLPSTGVQFTPIETWSTRLSPKQQWLQCTPNKVMQVNVPSVDTLGSRSRPSSYGRSNSWETPSSIGYDDFELSSTYGPEASNFPSKIPEDFDSFATSEDSKTFSEDSLDRDPSSSSVYTWYPAAGDQIENEVEEPNQQGLIKPRNGGNSKRAFNYTLLVLLCIFVEV